MPAGSDPLRPATLADFGGQADLTKRLRVVLDAARARGEMPDHLLFCGPPGLGKTTLAHIVAAECSANLVATSGPAFERPGDLAALLSGLKGWTVLFIDEIHRLPRTVEETLYPAMEDRVLDLTIGTGERPRTVRIPLEPFCLVGATTLTGLLSAPLRDRFGWTAKVSLYAPDELSQIAARSATLLGLDLDASAALQIASRSRGTPRIANKLLRHVRDFAQRHDRDTIDEATAAEALDWFGVDRVGLDATGVEILRALCITFAGGPVGLKTLATTIGEAPATVEEVYEPYLLHLGFLARTPKGRVATAAAWGHLGMTAPTEAGGQLFRV